MRLALPPARTRVALALAATLVALGALFAPADGAALLPPPTWHLLAGAALALVYAVALEPRRPRVVLGGAFLLAVVVLGGAELVQPTVGRHAELGDALADAAGAAVALVAYRLGHRAVRWRAGDGGV